MELNSNVADVDGPRLFQAERSKPMAFLLPLTRCLIFGASSVCGLTPDPRSGDPEIASHAAAKAMAQLVVPALGLGLAMGREAVGIVWASMRVTVCCKRLAMWQRA